MAKSTGQPNRAGCCKEILSIKKHGFVAANFIFLPVQEISNGKDILIQSMIYREMI